MMQCALFCTASGAFHGSRRYCFGMSCIKQDQLNQGLQPYKNMRRTMQNVAGLHL